MMMMTHSHHHRGILVSRREFYPSPGAVSRVVSAMTHVGFASELSSDYDSITTPEMIHARTHPVPTIVVFISVNDALVPDGLDDEIAVRFGSGLQDRGSLDPDEIETAASALVDGVFRAVDRCRRFSDPLLPINQGVVFMDHDGVFFAPLMAAMMVIYDAAHSACDSQNYHCKIFDVVSTEANSVISEGRHMASLIFTVFSDIALRAERMLCERDTCVHDRLNVFRVMPPPLLHHHHLPKQQLQTPSASGGGGGGNHNLIDLVEAF